MAGTPKGWSVRDSHEDCCHTKDVAESHDGTEISSLRQSMCQIGDLPEARSEIDAPMCLAPRTAAARPRSSAGTQAASSLISRQLLLPAAHQHSRVAAQSMLALLCSTGIIC